MHRIDLSALPEATAADPLRILVSGCLAGLRCGWDGASYDAWRHPARLASLPNVRLIRFCPEETAVGTPRPMSDIHGGDGFDVLDGRARVLSEQGEDWTEAMVAAARQMVDVARAHDVHLAVLMDMSAACGSQVISDGDRTRPDRAWRRGHGVAAALLARAGIPLVAQRDLRTLDALLARLDPTWEIDPLARDHHESDWYREHFGG